MLEYIADGPVLYVINYELVGSELSWEVYTEGQPDPTAAEVLAEKFNQYEKIKQQAELAAKAVAVIDWLMVETMPIYDEDKSENKALSDIYRFAHTAHGRCRNPHDNWREDLEKLYREIAAKEGWGETDEST